MHRLSVGVFERRCSFVAALALLSDHLESVGSHPTNRLAAKGNVLPLRRGARFDAARPVERVR